MEVNTGVLGAFRQSLRKDNPRDLLREILEETPEISEPDSLAELKKRMSEDHRDVCVEYWHANNYRSLVRPYPREEAAAAKAEAAKIERETREAVKANHKAIVTKEAKEMLLEMKMPNGKPLRDCTGKYCGQLGGWMKKIAEKVKGNQKVGAVLSEKDLQKLR